MLTKDERNYLKKIPASKKVYIKPFNPKAKAVGKSIIAKIKKVLPKSKILFMGATALGIAGQNDIDIYVLSSREKFREYLPALEKLFGNPKNTHETFIEWGFIENEFPVELYLTELPERQIKVYETLKSNKKLLKEYEKLKSSFDGKSYKDYQKAKCEFYNRIQPTSAEDFLGKEVEVIIDRPLGSKHPKHGFKYETNYGYVPNTKSPDGEELDAYYLGVDKPLKKAKGICIAIIHRTNDVDDKLVIVPEGTKLTNEEIEKDTNFQEQWFKHRIVRKD
jgi:inorganic pyrophosphatase